MNLSDFLTYIGFFIAAYSITQEYNRIKFRLSSKYWLVLFYLSLFLMFFSTFDWLKTLLIQEYYIKCIFNDFFWQSKYQIIFLINIISLYFMYTSTKLRKSNSKEFYELLYELETEKKYSYFDKLVKENLENIFKYKNLINLRVRVYNKIDPSISHNKRIMNNNSELSLKKKKFLDDGGDFSKLNNIGNIPSTRYTFIEDKRRSISNILKTNNNDFENIYNITVANTNRIKCYKNYDENFALGILKNIAKYQYYSESFNYIEKYLTVNLMDRKSLLFKNLYHDENNIQTNFIYENQNYEAGFDLGYIICTVIVKLLKKHQLLLSKNKYDYGNNEHIKHIYQLYELLGRLDGNKTHLNGEPLYIQRDLIKLIDFTKTVENQNIAFDILLNQINIIQELLLSSKETNNLNLYESMLINIFNIDNILDNILVEIGLSYSNYIFDNKNGKTIEEKIEEFRIFIISNQNNISCIQVFMKVFDEHRTYNGRDYISYTKNCKSKQMYWKTIFEFLDTIEQRMKKEAIK
ncbi:hypothetical protein [Arcobacter peruensis]|uniref:hypothetical protein n=1 Tax=Arcobacter peruensis TaxID=2320140 RepID=UPI000F09755C|nr:hypothetical protein [Arcobacter peruensis]